MICKVVVRSLLKFLLRTCVYLSRSNTCLQLFVWMTAALTSGMFLKMISLETVTRSHLYFILPSKHKFLPSFRGNTKVSTFTKLKYPKINHCIPFWNHMNLIGKTDANCWYVWSLRVGAPVGEVCKPKEFKLAKHDSQLNYKQSCCCSLFRNDSFKYTCLLVF